VGKKFKMSKMWYIRLVGAWSMFNFAQNIWHLQSDYSIQSSVADSAVQASQIANELMLKGLCNLSYMFFVFAIWLIFEIAVPLWKIRGKMDGKETKA
jgi:hypothetical protein